MAADWQTRVARGWEPALAVALGLAFAWVADRLVAPRMLQGGDLTGSDIGEHFWMLHALANPDWRNFSVNRYPLPSVVARLVCDADTPAACWRQAAFWATAALGTGIYAWARALAGVGAGLAAVVFALVFPELVIEVRTVTAYPLILAIWTLGAAAVAWAAARPGPLSVLGAGVAAGFVFASDARGLFIGLAMLPVGLLAVWRARPRWLAAPLLVLPIVGSFVLCGALPTHPRSLEDLLEASIEMSYTRTGARPPPRQQQEGGYVWGQSDLRALPATFRALRAAQARMNPAASEFPEQHTAVDMRMRPLAIPVVLIALGGVLALRRRGVDVAMLAPAAPMLVFLANAWRFEYYPRYAALGMSACAVLCGVGAAGWLGTLPLPRRTPSWLLPPALAVFLVLVPLTPLSLNASWRTRIGVQADLQRCLAGTPDPRLANDECVRAQATGLPSSLRWPTLRW